MLNKTQDSDYNDESQGGKSLRASIMVWMLPASDFQDSPDGFLRLNACFTCLIRWSVRTKEEGYTTASLHLWSLVLCCTFIMHQSYCTSSPASTESPHLH